ncbi:MAG: rod shape-determining protein MreC [Candidatus Omnitrophota bacterium]
MHKHKILKTLLLFSLFLIIFLVIRNDPGRFRIASVDSASPVLKTVHGIPGAIKRMIPFASFREENRLLRARIDYLSRRIEEMKSFAAENARLREILEFKKELPYATIAAQVIGRDPSNWSNSIIIDKGLNNGIRQNRAVLSVRGLVGRVVELGRRSSKILLISDPNSKVGVLIQRNRQGGILVGRPDGYCKMIYIALDADVKEGDVVFTAGLGSIFPRDVLVGYVESVDKEPGRLYKYAIVKPAQDLAKVEEVLCIR